MRVIAGAGRHTTIDRAMRLLGMGNGSIVEVAADDQGGWVPAALAAALVAALAAEDGPAIAGYLTRAEADGRDAMDYVPESSRRARAFPI